MAIVPTWLTVTPLAGGLRIIRGYVDDCTLDVNSEFTVNVGNIERIIQPLDISPVAGHIVQIGECRWLEKQPPAIPETTLAPNAIICPVRCTGANLTDPLHLETAHTNIGRVWFTLIVH